MAKTIKGSKFVATAATAALVASAIVPVASAAATEFGDAGKISTHAKEAVKYLVEEGIINGFSEDNTFRPQGTITRAEAATIFTKALKLDTTGSEEFSDVASADWFYSAVVGVFNAKIVNGMGDGTFAPEGKLTRAQAATMIVKAYGLTGSADLAKYTDAKGLDKWASDALATAVENGIMNGTSATTIAPNANITREDFATMIKRVIDVTSVLTVKDAKATSATSLTLTGTALDKLKAENLTVKGNTVTEVVASKDGKTATVKFASAFIIDEEYSLIVKIEEVESTFKFKFSYDITKAEVVAGTFDDDTKGQRIGLKINGADADFTALKVAGYTVQFVAVDSTNTNVTPAFFTDASTGTLSNAVIPVGDYTVQVSVSKGSNVVVSEKQTIKVRNLELAATALKDYVLTNGNTDVGEQNSSTLVVGETATIDEITVTANGADYDVTDATKFKVESSNPAVISVSAPTSGTLTANTPGTAKITVTYGDVKKEITLTVANATRKVAKFTPSTSSVAIVGTSKTASVTVSAVDQYGDLVANQLITVEAPASVATSALTVTTGNTGALNGKATITLTSVAAGSNVVLLKSNGSTLGSFGVRVTAYDNVASQKLEIVKSTDPTYSADAALDLSADVNVVYALNKYNSENLPNGTQDLTGYKVSYNADVVTIGAAATGLQDKAPIGAANLAITAKNVGSTTVAVYDATNLLVGQFVVTVTNTGYTIDSVAFKTVPTIDYKGKEITVADVLDITSSTNDDIVKGIKLSKPTAHAVRIDETTAELYIDADGNGLYTVGEVKLGTVTGEVVTGATGIAAGTFNIFGGVGGVTTANSGDKGTLVFKVMTSTTTIKASTSVNVNVK